MVWDHFRGGGPAFGREVGRGPGVGGQKVIKGKHQVGVTYCDTAFLVPLPLPSHSYNSSFSLTPQDCLGKEMETVSSFTGLRQRGCRKPALEQARQIHFKYFCSSQRNSQVAVSDLHPSPETFHLKQTGHRDRILDSADISYFPKHVSSQDSLFKGKSFSALMGILRCH